MKNAGPPAADQNLQQENTQSENGRFENEIADLREQLGKLSTEKDVLAQQYQQYILRLNGQVRTVNSQVFDYFMRTHSTDEACLFNLIIGIL